MLGSFALRAQDDGFALRAQDDGFAPRSQSQGVSGAAGAVVLIVLDGMRWQEVFGGADSALVGKALGGVNDTLALRKDFWRPTADARRSALFPFLWGTVAARGAIWGNFAAGSDAHVTNGFKFSYPGYNEMLVGVADKKIDKNAYGPNPNVTVFEWMRSRKGFAGRVAAFGTWETFADIFNGKQSSIFVHAGWEPPPGRLKGAPERTIDRLYRTTIRYWDDLAFDALMQPVVLDYVKLKKPRVLFVGYGETDEWAHERRYDLTLRSAHNADEFIAELWRTMQAMPEYRDRTTFIITTDHGRGSGAKWTDHGKDVDGAEQVWIAMLGPGTPKLGEVKGGAPVTQSQIAATIASLLGENYSKSEPRAAPPLVGARP
ncbi:MAG: alkaline phosphatase family protein [Gemmatimonadales bacterium]